MQKLRKDLLLFRVKIARNFFFLHIYAKKLIRANSEENLGIFVFRYFVLFCDFELFRYYLISSYFVILFNFEKQIQEMMNKFKIKPIRVNYTPACLCGFRSHNRTVYRLPAINLIVN